MLSKSTVKYIQSLQHKKFRDEHNAFVAEGPKVVGELLASGLFAPKAIYATAEWVEKYSLSSTQFTFCLEVVEDFELEKIANYSTPNMVVAEFSKRNNPVHTYNGKITFLLDDIQDPGNLGTIIRTCDWFGISQIVCSENTVDLYNSKVVQSTMASIGRVSVIYSGIASILRNNKIESYAAVTDGDDIANIGKLKEAFILVGNESKGISKELIGHCHHKISIQRKGKAESLNAAIATAIIAYAVV